MSKRKSRNKRERASKKKLEDVPMTPMIDVVFQLLIYFVLTFEIPDKMTQMQVWRPAPDQKSKPPETPIEFTRIGVYNGFYTLDDTRISTENLQRAFNRFADLNPGQTIIVIATADSRHKHLVTALDMLAKAGLTNISLLSSN